MTGLAAVSDDDVGSAYAAHLKHLADLIARDGFALQFVIGENPAGTFGYTVGLTARGLPELWIGSLHPQQAGEFLADIAHLQLESGKPLEPGLVDAGYTHPFRIRGPVVVDAAQVFLASAIADRPVTVMQVLWCDLAGRYPGDPDYSIRWMQRLLPLAGPDGRLP